MGRNEEFSRGIFFEFEDFGRSAQVRAVRGDTGIGRLELNKYPDEEPDIGDIWVDEAYRRQGIATKMLIEANKKLGPVRHNSQVSEDGRQWRDAMLRRGL